MANFDQQTLTDVRNELEAMLTRLTGKSDTLTDKEIIGTYGYIRDNAPNNGFHEYYKRLGYNPDAVRMDLKRRFPEVFNTWGFGDGSTVAADPVSENHNPTTPVPPAQPPAAQAAGAGVGNMIWLVGAAAVGGVIWYFNK